MMTLMVMASQKVHLQAMNNKMKPQRKILLKYPDSNDENDGQSTIEEPATSEGTNPLVEAIINQVNDVLSASGIPGL